MQPDRPSPNPRPGASAHTDSPPSSESSGNNKDLNRSVIPVTDGATTGKVLMPKGYTLIRELGRGGMGVVYLARDKNLGRDVAVKMMLATTDENALKRFYREARAMAKLQHPNVLQVYHIGALRAPHHALVPYMVLEYCAGGSLRKYVESQPGSRLPVPLAVRLMEQIARGVHHAHQKGITHRDLKPDNILLHTLDETRPGSDSAGTTLIPKVADFGLAKWAVEQSGGLTGTGYMVGTPMYMAPEQAEGNSKYRRPARRHLGAGGDPVPHGHRTQPVHRPDDADAGRRDLAGQGGSALGGVC